MGHLVLVRHGTSLWNKLGLWTGHTDIHLADEGIREAKAVGRSLADIEFHQAHVSTLTRAKQTLSHILDELGATLPTRSHEALNERHYGVHTGKNKWEVKEQVGEEEFAKIRRSWDHPIPEGESLKQVYERVVPYFETHIKPDLTAGKNVLIVAHGNSLRALAKYLEGITDDEIGGLEIANDEAHCYRFNGSECLGKEIRKPKSL